ncbi:hypothetical protein EIN_282270 [Entamoeba invadens IP1]|uniref:Uncharacterized protein n=1 Tax=Entamoeba invadens IP1 TaxID=370355 RepID=A0A0A1U048_ENTIV|nr:hypothetical protein EIN_282270 [Entamoeba invadens IP1]ELP85846.1 hypothetical protein EIN_282270 [Entamoeba invadens IP1]|eukprot:XP_004185192.1 hypothetical protein EIN_282270 [Entamoeba invadens IP1]
MNSEINQTSFFSPSSMRCEDDKALLFRVMSQISTISKSYNGLFEKRLETSDKLCNELVSIQEEIEKAKNDLMLKKIKNMDLEIHLEELNKNEEEKEMSVMDFLRQMSKEKPISPSKSPQPPAQSSPTTSPKRSNDLSITSGYTKYMKLKSSFLKKKENKTKDKKSDEEMSPSSQSPKSINMSNSKSFHFPYTHSPKEKNYDDRKRLVVGSIKTLFENKKKSRRSLDPNCQFEKDCLDSAKTQKDDCLDTYICVRSQTPTIKPEIHL